MNNFKHAIKNLVFNYLPKFFWAKKSVVSTNTGVCTLLCHKDVNQLIYALMSFFYYLGEDLPIFIIDDGTLTKNDRHKLKRFFKITIEPKKTSDLKMSRLIKKYKNFYTYRFNESKSFYKKKFDAILLCPFDHFIYLDSDVLFFKKPREIVSWLRGTKQVILYTVHDQDLIQNTNLVDHEFFFRSLLSKYLHYPVNNSFNSCLLCAPKKRIVNLSDLDSIFALFNDISYSLAPSAEETALSIIVSRQNKRTLLDAKKYLVCPYTIDYLSKLSVQTTYLHYCCESKVFFQKDAVKLAMKTRFFRRAGVNK